MMYLGDQAVGIACNRDFNPYKYAYSCYRDFYSADLPENITIDFENSYPPGGLEEMFRQCTGVQNITIKNLIMPDEGLKTKQMFGDNDNFNSITFENCRIRPTDCARMFTSGYNGVKYIYGPIDLSVSTATDPFYFARVLQHFEIVPNTMSLNYSLHYTGDWDNDTLISVANGLNPNVSMNANVNKFTNRLQALMGNVNNGLFTANENGTISLYNFITTVKGWTIT